MSTPKNALLGIFLRLPRKVAASLVVATMLFLSGCALQNAAVSSPETPFYLAYNSENVIRDQSQLATITTANQGAYSVKLEIDDVAVTPENMRSATNKHSSIGGVIADVLPGEHRIRLLTSNAPPLLPTTQHFEAGRIYSVYQMTLWTHVEENTSAEVAQKIAENRNNAVFEKKK